MCREEWHGRPEDIKQGSEEVHPESVMWGQAAAEHTKNALSFYMRAVGSGVAPEEARIVLPLNTMTEWIWSGTLGAWAKMLGLRLDPHAQYESQLVAQKAQAIIQPLFPVALQALLDNK